MMVKKSNENKKPIKLAKIDNSESVKVELPAESVKSTNNFWNQARLWSKKYWLPVLIGFIVGVLLILSIRFFTYHREQVHYHANFAIYIDGERKNLDSNENYEETSMCRLNEIQGDQGITDPVERVHMHQMSGDQVIHVEDHAVTYGSFFTNIGWTLGPNFIADNNKKVYQTNGENQLNIIINGQNVTDQNIANQVIKDQDVLLISYGKENDKTLEEQYSKIPRTAEKYDNTDDPASCSGSKTDKTSFSDRVKHLF